MSNYDNIPANLAAILNGNFNQEPVVVADPNEPTEEQRKLSDELVNETEGVYLLKIDAQGHDMHVLRGAADYIRTHPVYVILLEFSPMLMKAGGVEPLDLLHLLYDDLGYQCFDARKIAS